MHRSVRTHADEHVDTHVCPHIRTYVPDTHLYTHLYTCFCIQDGISDALRAAADVRVSLPMYGMCQVPLDAWTPRPPDA